MEKQTHEITFKLSLTFQDSCDKAEHKEVAEKVAEAIYQACHNGLGIAPEDSGTFTRYVGVEFLNENQETEVVELKIF
jgi:hypothetical protein